MDQPIYNLQKKYIAQVHFQVPTEDGVMIKEWRIMGDKIPAFYKAAYSTGLLLTISKTTIQAVSPFQIRTIFFIELQ